MTTGKAILRVSVTAALALAVSGMQPAFADSAKPSLLVKGPVESVSGAIATVFGMQLPNSASLAVGDEASVYGWLRSDGTLEVTRVSRTGTYVPGASEIVISGLVTTASTSVARATVGSINVDYSALLARTPELSLQRGYFVRFAGTQPTAGGLILASPASQKVAAQSEGALALTEFDARSAAVIDSLAVPSTDAGIIGTARNAGIIGTAKATTDAGIIGTARNAGIIGTAKATTDAGIIGTARDAGIIGTAKATATDAGIIGTARNAGIIGTAKATTDAGIIGTARDAGIIGTAKAATDAGIIGTARDAGIIGTGRAD
jgi:hypothetical protein